MALLVVDIGGSAVKYAVWDQNELKEKDEFPTPLTRGNFFDLLNEAKDKLANTYSFEGVTISTPGDVDEEAGLIRGTSAVPFLHLIPIKESLSEALGLPVSMENDANCAAIAEMKEGIGKGYTHPLFVIIGTGVGIAIVENGEVLRKQELKLDELDKTIAQQLAALKTPKASPVSLGKRVALKKFQMPSSIEGKEVFELAKEGDEVAINELQAMYDSLAQIMVTLNSAFEPEFIGIGGGVSNNDEFVPGIETAMKKLVSEDTELLGWFQKLFKKESSQVGADIPTLKVCKFKNDANLLGAVIHYQEMNPVGK